MYLGYIYIYIYIYIYARFLTSFAFTDLMLRGPSGVLGVATDRVNLLVCIVGSRCYNTFASSDRFVQLVGEYMSPKDSLTIYQARDSLVIARLQRR